MKKLHFIFLISLAAILNNSCKKENMTDCVKRTGKIITQIRALGNFNSIEVEDKLELYVSQGSNYEIKVEAGTHLQSNIRTEVKDSILTIRNINKCNFVRSPKIPIKVYVTLPRLRFLTNSGVGPVYFQNQFIQDSLYVRVQNSGDVHLNINLHHLQTSTHGNGDIYSEGSINYGQFYTNGTNFLRFSKMAVNNYMELNSYTIGDCFINAPSNGPMYLQIWESGNIYYKGTPADVSLKRVGKGNLIKE